MGNDRHAIMREYNKSVSSRAWQELRNSQHIEPALVDENGLRLGKRKLMLWISPAGFTDEQPKTLTVFEHFKATKPLLRKAVWNQSIDFQHLLAFGNGEIEELPTPTPTINILDTKPDSTEFEERLAQGLKLRIPIVWPWPKDRESLTTDVGELGFEFFDIAEPQASVRCGWSMDLPPEWEPIQKWFGEIYKWLDDHFQDGR